MAGLPKLIILACILIWIAVAVSGCCCCTQSLSGGAGSAGTIPGTVTAGKEAPAKAWLSIAQKAMKDKNPDAVLISIHGYSSEMGTSLPINGKCHRWWYQYASPADKKVYDVYVKDEALERVHERAFSDTGMEGILYKYGDPTITSWGLDSTDIIGLANEEYKTLTDKPASSAAYVLNLDLWGDLTWTVCYYDKTTRVIANLDVDPDTGAVGKTWLAPPAN